MKIERIVILESAVLGVILYTSTTSSFAADNIQARTYDDFTLQLSSPCIDAGTDTGLTEDYAGSPIPDGPSSDIGAYEYQVTTVPVVNDEDYLYDIQLSLSDTVVKGWSGDVYKVSYGDGKEIEFYVDTTNTDSILTYEIIPDENGFDIVYNLNNQGSSRINHPALKVSFINPDAGGSLYVLHQSGEVSRNAKMVEHTTDSDFIIRSSYTTYGYSPVIVFHNNDCSVGANLLYSYFDKEFSVNPNFAYDFDNSTGSMRFETFRHTKEWQAVYLEPGDSYSYRVAYRFSSLRNWIFTLSPYKEFFNSNFNETGAVQDRDRRPIMMKGLAASNQYSAENPRGFIPTNRYTYRVDLYGWEDFVNYTINFMKELGYEKILIWSPAGRYSNYILNNPDGTIPNFNYSMHIATQWTEPMEKTRDCFSKFKENNLSLGFWWGNADWIPVPDIWDPPAVRDMDYSNEEDMYFLRKEFQAALNTGVEILGLDAFDKEKDSFQWLIEMKQTAPEVDFLVETAGCDFMITISDHWIGNSELITGPNLLAWYLNPGRNLVARYSEAKEYEDKEGYQRRITELMRWGYTPLIQPTFHYIQQGYVTDIVTPELPRMLEAIDGIDNDGDGLIDMYDPGCADEFDDSEG